MGVNKLIKPYIQALVPYSTARDEFTGEAEVYLDANENPFASNVNRYPDPHHKALRTELSTQRGVPLDQIFVGSGSDEAIELLVRVVDTAAAGVTIAPPTYGMYKVAARNNNVAVIEAALNPDFSLNMERIREASDTGSKLLFICSPNNPTGTQYTLEEVRTLVEAFQGVIVVDEAYIDFATGESAVTLLPGSDRLVVLQTFSKAWGMAGIRLGVAYAAPALVAAMNKLKLPYNVSTPTQQAAIARLCEAGRVEEERQAIVRERDRLAAELVKLPCIEHVFPSEGNFLLVRFKEAQRAFLALRDAGVIVRDRSNELHCTGCLRITIGTVSENNRVVGVLAGS